jgi:hypothetical protein
MIVANFDLAISTYTHSRVIGTLYSIREICLVMNRTTSVQLDIRICFIGNYLLSVHVYSAFVPLLPSLPSFFSAHSINFLCLKYELTIPLYLYTLYLPICASPPFSPSHVISNQTVLVVTHTIKLLNLIGKQEDESS